MRCFSATVVKSLSLASRLHQSFNPPRVTLCFFWRCDVPASRSRPMELLHRLRNFVPPRASISSRLGFKIPNIPQLYNMFFWWSCGAQVSMSWDVYRPLKCYCWLFTSSSRTSLCLLIHVTNDMFFFGAAASWAAHLIVVFLCLSV